MRKLIIMLLLTMALTLAACGSTSAEGTVPPTADPSAVPTEDTAPPTEPVSAPTETEPQELLQPGYYLLHSMAMNGETVEGESVESLRYYIEIREDHTGIFGMMGKTFDLEWDNTYITVDGGTLSYCLNGNNMVINTVGMLQGLAEDAEMTFCYNGDVLPEEYAYTLKSGYFLISSVGDNGDITFYGSLDPANGYLKLKEDGTGFMSYGGVEQELTWDADNLYWNGQILPYTHMTYFDAELGRDDSMLMVYFINDATSVAMRPADEPES